LTSDQVVLTETAEACLLSLSPRERGLFSGVVISLLIDNLYRAEQKIDLSAERDGEPVWALFNDYLFIEFMENESIIGITNIGRLSQFRPPLRPF
jgi:hypothetical protein